MMLLPFEKYVELGKARKTTPDPERASSLIRKAKTRLEYLAERKPNKKNSQFVLEDSYDAIREAIHCLMSLGGYKSYSHEASISFMRDLHEFKEKEIYSLDRYRKLRNDSVYSAKRVNVKDAESAFNFAKELVRKIEEIIKSS